MRNLTQEHFVSSQYFAPRGRERLLFLGEQISHRHLKFQDKLIGIVGDAGAGKSSLIKGMFPGLELTNDDDMLNPHKIMQVRDMSLDITNASTFHLDMRFQMGFTQMCEIVDFVTNLLDNNRRIIVEHFNLLYPALGMNADLIVGIGEEIIVTRPTIFGPNPQDIYQIVHTSLKYRKMAHSLEDITIHLLQTEFGIDDCLYYSSDMRNGFVLRFIRNVDLDFERLSSRVSEEIGKNLSISYLDENHIMLGEKVVLCDGPRLHVRNTSEIEHYSLLKNFIFDPSNNTYCLLGMLSDEITDIHNINTLYFLKRKD